MERIVPFVRNSFFAGETFIDLADAQRRAEQWCKKTAGNAHARHHSCRRPRNSQRRGTPALLRCPLASYDLPLYKSAKVHKDHHIEVAKALYSVPGNLIGETSMSGPTPNWSRCSSGASWSRSIPARHPAVVRPTRPTCPMAPPSTLPAIFESPHPRSLKFPTLSR